MSKLHRDNAGYVGVSYEETQDPYYSYNKLALPLGQSDKTVVRDEVTFTVTVAGGKFVIDGTSQATVSLLEGNVYTFDQSDSSNGNHPLKFSYTADGTHGGGQEFTLGVTTNGTPGQSGAYTRIVVAFGLHDLKYYCANHTGMGGSATVTKSTDKFTVGLPILTTTDAFGLTVASGSPVNKDPYAAHLVLAIPGNSTGDRSADIRGLGTNKTVTATNASVVTTTSKFYGSSIDFTGSSSAKRLAIPASPDFNFGDEPWTFEFWAYHTTTPGGNSYVFDGPTNAFGIGRSTNGYWIYTPELNIGQVDLFPSIPIPSGRWYHVAIQRTNRITIEAWLDGELKHTIENTAMGIFGSDADAMTIGNTDGGSSSYNYNGNLQNIRIYKGIAKYGTPFPTGSYGMDVVTWTGNGGLLKVGGGASASEGVTATGTGGVSGISTTYGISGAFDGSSATYLATNGANISSNAAVLTVTFPTGNQPSYSSSVVVDVYAGTSDTVQVAINGGAYQTVSGTNNWVQHTVATGSGTITEIKVSRQKSVSNAGAAELRAIIVDGVQLLDGTGPGLFFQPDLVWVKRTNSNGDHQLYDSVRGVLKGLSSDQAIAEWQYSGGLSSFNSDGFSVGSLGGLNGSGDSHVAWCWRAGGAASSNTDGSITSQVSASDKYGFSVVTWTGQSSGSATIGHGLSSSAPKFIIVKGLTGSVGWTVGHDSVGWTKRLKLNSADAESTSANYWNDTAPTSSVFTSGANNVNNTFVAYCWSEVPGFSNFGKFTGLCSSSKTVTLGFKPKFVIIKRIGNASDGETTYGGWGMYQEGETDKQLMANCNGDEGVRGNCATGAQNRDIQANVVFNNDGFTVSSCWYEQNDTVEYLYAAWAESAPGDPTFERVMVEQLDLEDLSGNNNNASNAGATFQTSVKKFYDGAVDFGNTSQDKFLTIPASSDYSFGTGPWCIECWAYIRSTPTNGTAIWDFDTGSGYTNEEWISAYTSGGVVWFYWGHSGYDGINATYTANQWQHWAWTWDGTTARLFRDGTVAASTTTTNKSGGWGSATRNITIGKQNYDSPNRFGDQLIQDLRIYKGTAKYTSSFSPPERSVQGTARRYPSGIYVVS